MTKGTQLIAFVAAATAMVASPAWARSARTPAPVAVEDAASTLGPNQFVWNDPGGADPVRIVVNLGEQRAYVYRGETLVAATTVSTGMDGKATPSGVFPILQKNADHRSNLYNDAAMPFMQRLTWDGVAIHAGRNPGFPASHGCIRVPLAFAKKLFGVTALGTEVTVIGADGEIAPTPPPPDPETDATAAANRGSLRIASLEH